MTQEQPQEQKSLIDRIIAPTKEDEARAFEFFQKLFEFKDPIQLEKKKTQKEIEIIRQINKDFAEFLKSYGVGNVKKIPPEKIRIVDINQLNDAQKNTAESLPFRGRYDFKKQNIIIIPGGSTLFDISIIIHEMLHAQSFLSFDVNSLPQQAKAATDYDSTKLSIRRSGFNVYTFLKHEPISAFRAIDEAVIEELTKEFYYKYISSIPSTNGVFEKTEQNKKENEIDDDDVIDLRTENLPDGSWQETIWSFGYAKERSDLWDLIDDIFENDKSGEFQSREDIFKIFVKAQMTGKLLPLGRVIKRVYGQGAFKFLGEITKDTQKK